MAIELDGLYGINSDGNITTGSYYIGDGRYLTNITSNSYSDANVIALLSGGTVPTVIAGDIRGSTLEVVSATVFNTVTAGSFIGDGSQLTNLPAGNLANVTTDISTTANISGNSIYSDNYFYANGAPFTTGASGVVIGDQQITGTGSTTYSLTQAATTQSVLVALNGVTQYPVTAYTVVGNSITFASAVSNANVIDIRYFAAGGGNSAIYGDANVALFLPTYSGNLGTANTTPINAIFTDGYFYANGTPVTFGGTANSIINGTTSVSIPVADGNIIGSVGGISVMVLTPNTVAMGGGAGSDGTTLGNYSVAVGYQTAQINTQGDYAVAVGAESGFGTQGFESVAVGHKAGYVNQSTQAVAIGAYAGEGQLFGGIQGQNSIAIGAYAGQLGQADYSIILNASGTVQRGPNSGFYVNPVRDYTAGNVKGGMLTFNSATNEIAMGMPALPSLAGNTAANTAAGTNVVGMMYWDTSSSRPRMWDGSAWLQITLS